MDQPYPGKPSSDDLVTVTAYKSPQEAQLAKGLLESHGVPAFIPDENILRLGRHYQVDEHVRLQVRESDLPIAAEILESPSDPLDWTDEGEETGEIEPRHPESGAAGDFQPFTDDSHYFPVHEEDEPRCPQCGNANFERSRSTLGAVVSVLLLGLPALLTANRVRCTMCGTVWRRR